MKRDDTDPAAVGAIERVLQAEFDGAERIAQARQHAAALLEQARNDGLAIVNRALARGARWQQTHAARLERRLRALRDESEVMAPDLPAGALDAAAARVAAELVESETPDDGTR